MQITLEQYESIQNYLDGAMTPQQEKDFLIEIDKNVSLKESFEFEKELRQNLTAINDKKNLLEKDNEYYETAGSSGDSDSIKNLIEKARSEWEEEHTKLSAGTIKNITHREHHLRKTKVVKIKLWFITAAAACLVLAVAGLVLFLPKSSAPPPVAKSSPNKKDSTSNVAKTIPNDSVKNINPHATQVDNIALFNKHYAKDTANPEMPELLATVPSEYKNGDNSFQEINLNSQPLTRGSSNDINSKQNILQLGHYYKGLSYIETRNNKQAIENLQWVIDSAQSRPLKIKAQWYLSLIFLKEGNIKKTTSLLTSLSKNETAYPYNKEAVDILKKLNAAEETK